jgi:hypothetical protein
MTPTTNAPDWEKIYDEIANGNVPARALLVAWGEFVHELDDCIDRDKPADSEKTGSVLLNWTLHVSNNPFWREHSPALSAIAICSINAYLDSERWKQTSDLRRRRYADAYRSFWDEFYFLTAFFTGGYRHMRKMSIKFRDMAYTAQHES